MRLSNIASRSSYKSDDERNDEKRDRNPEQEPGTFHSRAGNAAETQEGGDESNDEKYHGPVQKIAHGLHLHFRMFIRGEITHPLSFGSSPLRRAGPELWLDLGVVGFNRG